MLFTELFPGRREVPKTLIFAKDDHHAEEIVGAVREVFGNPAGTQADIVMLVRYAIGEAEALEPLPSFIAGRFNLWLGREEKAGRSYTEEQRQWLMAIRDHLAVNIEIRPEDMMDAPEFSARGGIVRARALFGTRLSDLLDELSDVLVA